MSVHLNFNGLLFVLRKFVGLGKSDELNGRLFDLIFYIVSRIRRLHIKLNNFFTRLVTNIFYRDVESKFVVRPVICTLEAAPSKVGIRKTVSEGISHNAFVIIAARISLF